MPLINCESFGTIAQISDTPEVFTQRDALFMPKEPTIIYDLDHNWGVYDLSGRLVEAAAYRRGPGPTYVGQSLTLDRGQIKAATAPEQTYIYCGPEHAHFGHFLLSTLPRFWQMRAGRLLPAKILCHLDVDAEVWLSVPFVRQIFSALGLTASDFVRFTEPTIIPELIIPAPSFEEASFGSVAFRSLCTDIYKSLHHLKRSSTSKPAYLSKENLTQGVRRIVNEDIVTNFLAMEGVDIFLPEQLSVSEQLQLFQDRRVIAGSVGSALHSSIFAPSVPAIIGLSASHIISASFPIIDMLTGADATYVYPDSGVTELNADSSFMSLYRLDQPLEVAANLMRIIEQKARSISM
jgi:hypothetical protein